MELYGTIILAIISLIVIFSCSLRHAWLRRKKSLNSDIGSLKGKLEKIKWYQKLNLGAFLFSSFWLFSNGFWVSGLALLTLNFIAFPVSLIFSVLLLFKGTDLSWGGRHRWGYDVVAFMDEQFFWSFLAILVSLSLLFLIFLEWL